ncbi:MAG: hypothetical protein DYH13_09885 [Alphaproteobacteria bacterium PRO2]|nr:hypothetical protein [Alphaproteobacteria bacterium PRO2]
MSEAYEKYAKDVYATVFKNMKSALHAAGKKSLLVVSGESHGDSFWETWVTNTYTPDEKEKPALAAAYAHISAMTAAEKLVGQKNVIVSIEATPERIQEILKKFDKGLKPEEIEMDRGTPMTYALYHAYESGFKIVGTDSGSKKARKLAEEEGIFPDKKVDEAIASEERLGAERNEIGKLASKAKIVVHLGGAAHIPSFYGHKMDEDFTKPDSLQMTHHANPMLKYYGRVIFFNSADKDDSDLTATFFSSTRNAIQFKPPGKMSPRDSVDINEQVLSAAESYNMSPVPSSPTAPGMKR